MAALRKQRTKEAGRPAMRRLERANREPDRERREMTRRRKYWRQGGYALCQDGSLPSLLRSEFSPCSLLLLKLLPSPIPREGSNQSIITEALHLRRGKERPRCFFFSRLLSNTTSLPWSAVNVPTAICWPLLHFHLGTMRRLFGMVPKQNAEVLLTGLKASGRKGWIYG